MLYVISGRSWIVRERIRPQLYHRRSTVLNFKVLKTLSYTQFARERCWTLHMIKLDWTGLDWTGLE